MALGEIRTQVVGTKAAPLIELEFWPPDGLSEPVGIRMPPASAAAIVADLVAALEAIEVGDVLEER